MNAVAAQAANRVPLLMPSLYFGAYPNAKQIQVPVPGNHLADARTPADPCVYLTSGGVRAHVNTIEP